MAIGGVTGAITGGFTSGIKNGWAATAQAFKGGGNAWRTTVATGGPIKEFAKDLAINTFDGAVSNTADYLKSDDPNKSVSGAIRAFGIGGTAGVANTVTGEYVKHKVMRGPSSAGRKIFAEGMGSASGAMVQENVKVSMDKGTPSEEDQTKLTTAQDTSGKGKFLEGTGKEGYKQFQGMLNAPVDEGRRQFLKTVAKPLTNH